MTSYYENLTRAGRAPLIIDAGANIGASVVYFCSVYPDSLVVAIEPEGNNCRLLEMNCEGLNYRLLEGGIGSENATLFLDDPGRSDWGFRLCETGDRAVRVYSADDLVNKRIAQGDCPFIFKIDIEGGLICLE